MLLCRCFQLAAAAPALGEGCPCWVSEAALVQEEIRRCLWVSAAAEIAKLGLPPANLSVDLLPEEVMSSTDLVKAK